MADCDLLLSVVDRVEAAVHVSPVLVIDVLFIEIVHRKPRGGKPVEVLHGEWIQCMWLRGRMGKSSPRGCCWREHGAAL